MFERFPKVRSELPPKMAEIYTKHYRENRQGATPASSLAQRMESWLHRQVAEDVVTESRPRTTLEIGAGTLNQIQYEPDRGPYDIVEPFVALFEGAPELERVRHVYSDIAEAPDDARYDRITAVATFEHICNLPEVVARSGLLLEPQGTLRTSIPSEGTFLWKLGWMMTTGIEFRMRYGMDYGTLMRHEHVNDAKEIEEVLRYFFRRVEQRVFGLSAGFSLYQFYCCADPIRDRASEYLASMEAKEVHS